MNRGSTMFLRSVVFLLGLMVLAACVVLGSAIAQDKVGDYEPVIAGMYVAAIPFYAALFQTIKLLNYIDRGTAFSELTVNALRKVKLCALTISGLYTVGLPAIFIIADRDDSPGSIALALMIIGTSLVIATSAGVLQQLMKSAVDLKSENDLTV